MLEPAQLEQRTKQDDEDNSQRGKYNTKWKEARNNYSRALMCIIITEIFMLFNATENEQIAK